MRGASVLKANDDKTQALGKNSLMAISGESGDTSTFPPPLVLKILHTNHHSSIHPANPAPVIRL